MDMVGYQWNFRDGPIDLGKTTAQVVANLRTYTAILVAIDAPAAGKIAGHSITIRANFMEAFLRIDCRHGLSTRNNSNDHENNIVFERTKINLNRKELPFFSIRT